MKKKIPMYLRNAQSARRNAEVAAGIRTDRRFVEKSVPSKRRKKQRLDAQRELREGNA